MSLSYRTQNTFVTFNTRIHLEIRADSLGELLSYVDYVSDRVLADSLL